MTVIEEIQAELCRATAKYPTWPTDPLHALAVLGEEFGELYTALILTAMLNGVALSAVLCGGRIT